MSNSTLATKFIKAADCNHYGERTADISMIIVHHMAAKWTAERCAKSFADENRGASATYCIGYNGEIVRCLDESFAPGTSGNYAADNTAVTIEVANCEMGGQWEISDAAMKSLIKLCADIAKRNKLGTLIKGKNLCWHQMYAATACPGPYLISKMGYIADEANKINTKGEINVKIDGINIQRSAEMLVLYAGKETTGTNKWGVEVALDGKGVAISDPVYGVGNMKIPAGGFVLSGHNTKGSWLLNNVKKGKKLNFEVNV